MTDRKAAQLSAVEQEMRQRTTLPLRDYREDQGYELVFGEGPADADMVFVGEAPGRQEAKTGRPFVGSAGQLLDELLDAVEIERGNVYITNVVKDRPPGNRDPHVDEIEAYGPYLWKQIEIIEPDVLVTLGRFAMDYVLDHVGAPESGEQIGALHGERLEIELSYGSVIVVPLYHPAAAFYNRDLRETMAADIQVLSQLEEES